MTEVWPLVIGVIVVVVVGRKVYEHYVGKAIGAGFKAMLKWADRPNLGKVWGSPDSAPDGWNPEGNAIWVDVECDYVIEGRRFLPMTTLGKPEIPTGAGGGSTLVDTLSFESELIPWGTNPAWGYVDRMAMDGLDAKAIANAIFVETAPMCWDAGPGAWGDGVTSWYEDLLERIRRRVREED